MRLVIVLIVLSLGVILGLGATWLVVEKGFAFDEQRVNGWVFAAEAGSADLDPYRRAILFAGGELPLASGEGLTLKANIDHDGAPPTGACTYRLHGALPLARFWTLTLTDRNGHVVDNPARRYGFTSSEIIRIEGGDFDILISAQPQPWNWLPAPKAGPFILVFRFYETALSASATVLDSKRVPDLIRLDCAT